MSQKMRKLLTVALPMQGVWFLFTVPVNNDSEIYPNIFLGIKLLQNSCQNVYDSNIDNVTMDKKDVVIFQNFTADRDFGTYHMLFLGVNLPLKS